MTAPAMGTRLALHMGGAIVLAFFLLPILAVVPASFNEASFIRLPPRALSLRWYGDFFADPAWLSALLASAQVAISVTVISLCFGTAAALGLRQLPASPRRLLMALFLAPLILPVIVSAVAMYRSALELQLNNTFLGLVLGHCALALPFVIVNVEIALRALHPDWPKAAAGLGAGPWTIFRTITLSVILPGVLAGAVFAFVTSFDEFTIALFMTGPETKTLPIKIWESIRYEFSPIVAVAATCLIGAAFLLFLLTALFGRRPDARPA